MARWAGSTRAHQGELCTAQELGSATPFAAPLATDSALPSLTRQVGLLAPVHLLLVLERDGLERAEEGDALAPGGEVAAAVVVVDEAIRVRDGQGQVGGARREGVAEDLWVGGSKRGQLGASGVWGSGAGWPTFAICIPRRRMSPFESG